MGSFCFSILLLSPHKTLRFYYVNVYRTICFFSASLSSRARVLVMMMNYWWNSFSSLPRRRILFPFLFHSFILWPPSCCRAIEICLRTNPTPILITMFQSNEIPIMSSQHQMELFLDRWWKTPSRMPIQLFRVTRNFTVDISTKVQKNVIKYFSMLFAANVSRSIVSGISSTSRKRRCQAESTELQDERFFFGADVYENGN